MLKDFLHLFVIESCSDDHFFGVFRKHLSGFGRIRHEIDQSQRNDRNFFEASGQEGGGPEGIRTLGRSIKSRTLYLAELQARTESEYNIVI